MAAPPNGLLNTFEYMDFVLATYVTDISSKFIGAISPIIVLGIGIHYTLIAYAIIRGQENDPIQKIIKEAFTTVFIIGLALTLGSYQTIVIDGVKAITEFITSNLNQDHSGTLYGKISGLWGGNIIKYDENNIPAISALWDMAKKNPILGYLPNLDYMLGGFLMMIANIILCILCIIPYFISKIYIIILLAIGPIFIMAAIWPATRNYFSAWLANLVGNILTISIVTAIVNFATTAYTKTLIASMENVADPSKFQPILVGGATLIIAIFLGMIATQASQQGAQLAGGGLAMDSKGAAGMVMQTLMQKMSVSQRGGAQDGAQGANDSNSMSKGGGMLAAAGKVASVGLAAAGGPMTSVAIKGISRIAKGLNKRG